MGEDRDRHVVDGKVAVLVSPGHGAGWSTWGSDDMAFDPGLVALVLANAPRVELESYARSRWPGAYTGGLAGLCVRWVPTGTVFCIEVVDGSEAIREFGHYKWLTA